MEQDFLGKNCILIIDDDFINRELLKNIFSSQYTFEEAGDGLEGLEQIGRHADKLCAIILDVQMSRMNGIELLERISADGITERIPTFLITAQDDDELVNYAYTLGVVDVVSKPVTPIVIQKRVRTVIELFSAREKLSATVKGQEMALHQNSQIIEELHRGTIEALAAAIEFRDIESGQHVGRIYGITKYILSNTAFGEGLAEDEIDHIARGAIMHDVGKIAISDVILNKPGRLTREEFETMKRHTTQGAELIRQICQTQLHDIYRHAMDIALHHHERWDGRGYPDGLVGDQISVAAQVVSIADVYDALVSVRVYKKAFTPDEAVRMIENGECGQFNPKLIECFLEVEPVIRTWYEQDAEEAMLRSLAEAPGTGASTIPVIARENNAPSSVVDVMLLMTAVQSAYDMIISANLTRNSYYMIDYDRFETHCADNLGVFDELIEYGSASIPVSHRSEFHDTFCRENLLREFHAGKKSIHLRHPQYSDDGKLHWVSTRVLFLEDARSGDILQITLARYIDDEIAEKEQTRKILTDALHLAEQANNAKYDFLSKMSHDIRTPLNAIIGMTTIIAANLGNEEKINDCLVKIGTSSKYLLGIVNDVLDYAKIENNTMSLHLSDFNMRDLITEVAEATKHQAQLKHQTLEVTVDKSVDRSYIGDEFRIRQVITNLLDNACTYTQAGGHISMRVGADSRPAAYDVVSFTVQDNGQGIRAEFIDRLFEPFAQDDGADRVESIGLGLPISQNLAHLMNGDIAVSSEPGVGSTFTFELPLERGNLSIGEGAIDTDINVLVVDDDLSVCEHTAILLQKMGIQTMIADNGFDAVELIGQNRGTPDAFDVAIIDWKMPDMDGVETVRRIRRLVGRDVLVAVMSAYDWSTIEEEAREAGVDLFIAKPISENNLRTTIACSEKIRREEQRISFDGEKVLIVEDNEFNAEVAKAILEMKNLRVEVAPNGKVAYETFMASRPGEYLAILMDVLMPVMDGHEATRAIRASSHPEAQTMPIYAVTANAFYNDILEAKLAGMNGHITKPIDFDEVARILQSIVKNKQRQNAQAGGGYLMVNCEILTNCGLDVDGLLKRLMGNEALVQVFIKKFLEDKTIDRLREAFATQDMAAAETASHTLKGMCGNLSLTALFELFTEQVNLIRAKDYGKAEAMMAAIEAQFAGTTAGMRDWLASL